MATLASLTGTGGPLTDLSVPLGRHEVQARWILAYPQVIKWLQNDLPNLHQGRLNVAQTPLEQVDDLLYRWIAGKSIKYDKMFKDLTPMADEVWEMKTADIRIFGWMCEPRKFVAVLPGFADDYKGKDSWARYEAAKQAVIRARNALPLNEPKIATGVFDALVSV